MTSIIVLISFGILLIAIGTLVYFKSNKRNRPFTVRKFSLKVWFRESIWLIFVVAGIILLGLCVAVNLKTTKKRII